MSVSKSGSTRVSTAKLIKTCEQLGLTTKGRAGWILAWHGEDSKRRLLIHTGKKGTNCIELVGFESKHAVKHPCPPARTMTQMLDCNLTQSEILRNFYKVAKDLVAGPVVKKPVPTVAEIMNDSPAVSEVTESTVLA